MDFTFSSIIDITASFFGNSTTLAGLALMLMAWAVCAVILYNCKAPPQYSIAVLIPIGIFFTAYGVLNETIMLFICLVSAFLVASELRKSVG